MTLAAIVLVLGFFGTVTAYQAAVITVCRNVWGTGGDYFRWGVRGWKSRAPRGVDTHTSGVYVQFGWLPVVAYNGQSVNPAQRFQSEGKNIMALVFAWGYVIRCRPEDMNDAETFLIRWMPWTKWFGFNVTDGGSKRREVTRAV